MKRQTILLAIGLVAISLALFVCLNEFWNQAVRREQVQNRKLQELIQHFEANGYATYTMQSPILSDTSDSEVKIGTIEDFEALLVEMEVEELYVEEGLALDYDWVKPAKIQFTCEGIVYIYEVSGNEKVEEA